MKLGFVSAILPEVSLKEVLRFAKTSGYDCVELMCWPVSKAERRYAGVTHVDCTKFDEGDAARLKDLAASIGVAISGLGYYPNALAPDESEAKAAQARIVRVIEAAAKLGVGMNTFIGRDWTKSVDDNWPRFLEVWQPILARAEKLGVKVGIENCPMLFSKDEWPGGKNLAHSPAIWNRLFNDIRSPNFGLNYDPSHLVWQQMDYLRPILEFRERIFHVHAKDVRLDQDQLDRHGILAHPLQYHIPKLPGLGEVNWGKFFSVLGEIGYRGPVCVEVEDRSYEGTLADRKAALVQSAAYLRQFCAER